MSDRAITALHDILRVVRLAKDVTPAEAFSAFAYIETVAQDALVPVSPTDEYAGAHPRAVNAVIAFIRARRALVQEVHRLVTCESWKTDADKIFPWIAPNAYKTVENVCLRAMRPFNETVMTKFEVKSFFGIDLSSPQIWYIVAREFQK
jgi:hypothetical protein